MLRKLLVAGLITLTKPFGVVVQAQLAILVFAIALYFQLEHKPFRNPVVNVLETTGIVAFLFTAWLGVLMSLPDVPMGWKEDHMNDAHMAPQAIRWQVMSVLAVLINAFVVLMLVGSFVYAAWFQV